jgi:Holliday junction resolvasome RuvABC endonuclease subunit
LIVIGFDPGFGAGCLGYGVLDLGATSSRALAHGTLGHGTADWTAAERLDEIAFSIDGLLNTWCPDVLGYEDQSGVCVAAEREGRSNFAARRLHEVTGMLRFAARCSLDVALPCYVAQPRSLKIAVLGKGGGSADKSQIKVAVQRLFGVRTNQHAADAIACAVATARIHRVTMAQLRASGSVIT